MKHEILVIDDEWQERAADYKRFEAATNTFAKSFAISFDFLPDPIDLSQYLNSKRYSAVVIDAKLDGNWTNAPLPKLLPLIGNELPIALVSSRWDNTIVDDVNVAWEMPNCKTFLRWSEVQGQEDGGMRRVAFLLSKIISEYMQLDLAFGLNPDESLRILHISDLQFGPKIAGDMNGLAINCAETILDGWGTKSPHIIAITGDVAERGLPAEYSKAFEWLGFFTKRLGFGNLPSRRLLLVPGNHDYCLPFAAAPRVNFKEAKGRKNGSSDRRRELGLSKQVGPDMVQLGQFSFRPYVDFVNRVSDCPWIKPPTWVEDPCLSWVEGRFRHLGVLFYGLNTNNPVNSHGFSGRKALPNDLTQIQKSLVDLQKTAPTPVITIGLGHHSPVGNSGRRADAENLGDLSAFLQGAAKTACFLHGHIHKAEVTVMSKPGFKLLVSTASTLTLPEDQRPEDTSRGFSLIELERKQGSIVGITATPFNLIKHRFVPEEQTKHIVGR